MLNWSFSQIIKDSYMQQCFTRVWFLITCSQTPFKYHSKSYLVCHSILLLIIQIAIEDHCLVVGRNPVYQQQHTRDHGRQLGRCPQYSLQSSGIVQAGGGHTSRSPVLWHEFGMQDGVELLSPVANCTLRPYRRYII